MVIIELILKILTCIPYILKFDWSSIPGVFRGYIFEEYNKHVTVYKTGNAIIINSLKIKVFNPAKTNVIYRSLDIRDGKKDIEFPTLAIMKDTTLKDRFEEFGFWICSENKIVSKVEEYYWKSEDTEEIDEYSKKDPRIIKYRINLDEGKLKRNKTYYLTYVISVPGMFPIEKGFYYPHLHNECENDYKFSSSITVEHAIKKLIYTVSFERGVKVDVSPVCYIKNKNKNFTNVKKQVHGNLQDNFIYHKYTYIMNRPKYRSTIDVSWNIKNGEKKKYLKKYKK